MSRIIRSENVIAYALGTADGRRSDVLAGERIQPYYLMFREAVKTARIKTAVAKGDCPYVGITEHPTADGRTIVIAINFEPRAIDCPIAVDGTVGEVWRGDVKADRIRLAANEAAIFLVE